MSTLASDGPTRAISSSTGCIAGDSAISIGRPSALRDAVLGLEPLLRAAARGRAPTCVRTIASSRSLSHGFSTKSRAPRRIASTATSTMPQAVITTTGSVASCAVHLREQVEAFLARRRVARVVEVHQDGVELAPLERARDAQPASSAASISIALGLEQQAQRFEHVGLIVGDEEASGRCRHRGCYSARSATTGSTRESHGMRGRGTQ